VEDTLSPSSPGGLFNFVPQGAAVSSALAGHVACARGPLCITPLTQSEGFIIILNSTSAQRRAPQDRAVFRGIHYLLTTRSARLHGYPYAVRGEPMTVSSGMGGSCGKAGGKDAEPLFRPKMASERPGEVCVTNTFRSEPLENPHFPGSKIFPRALLIFT
jgi:hypothetical protein